MRTSTAIKLSLFMGSICLTAWQLPRVLESVEGAKKEGLLGIATGGADPRSAVLLSVLGAAAAQQGAQAPGAEGLAALRDQPPAPPDPKDLRVFGPGAANLSQEQRERLLKQAAANAPRVPITRPVGSQSRAAPKGAPPEAFPGVFGPLSPEQMAEAQRQIRGMMSSVPAP